MESQFGVNTTTWYVIFPILVIIAIIIILFVVKIKTTVWKQTAIAIGGLFAFIGLTVVIFGVYYNTSTVFSNTFKYYALSAFSISEDDPFTATNNYQSVIMTRGMQNDNGEVKIASHPNPYAPTPTILFVRGKFIDASIQNDTLTYLEDEESAVEETSLWWALTKNIFEVVYDASDWVDIYTQDLGNNFTSHVPTGWKIEGSGSEAINTVKFGSPAEQYTFIPETESMSSTDMYISPVISTSSFTIDSRLSARDVTNLIQDNSTADKIENGTDECIFPVDVNVSGIGYYAYFSDNTDITKCTDLGTEIGKSMTLVLKNEGDERVILVTLVSQNDTEFDGAYYSFREFVNLMKIDNTSFQLSKLGIL